MVVADGAGKYRHLPHELRNKPMMDLLTEWETVDAVLAASEQDQLEPVSDFEVIAPITYPRAVLCAGANYVDHFEEMGIERPAVAPPPFFFLKPPVTTVVGPDAAVALPAGDNPRFDYEAELAVVIGRTTRRVAPDEALDHVAGYTIANDLSARGRFVREDAIGAPFAFDWLGHKSQDGSCPLGPGLVPARLVGDPSALAIRTEVNGAVKQDNTTAAMYVPLQDLISYASHTMTLNPGDVILTGTPAGVGAPRGEFLEAGDVVSITIEGLGTLVTPIGPPDVR
ncbi:fumarylacetoacetate hydrolase family protein [Streptomyces sp. Y7]|uniref:fumarylacetoacetate hydrolase family protein n=1 Tax=Streptomyces sp. Y7 TaxID=3342392 RepID=UPI003718A288